jgi:hypothetical protein
MTTLSEMGDEFENNPGKATKKLILKIVLFALLLSGIGWAVDFFMIPANTVKDIAKKTLSADNVLQNYEWFKQQYQDYMGIGDKITQADSAVKQFKRDLPKSRTEWSFDDKNEYDRLNSIYTGFQYQRVDIAKKYNARSRMLNRELFKTKELPDSLSY